MKHPHLHNPSVHDLSNIGVCDLHGTKVVSRSQPALLGSIRHYAVTTDVRHLDESWCPADCTKDTLVITFKDEGDSGEEVQEEHESLAGDGPPWLEAHGVDADAG